MQMHIGKHFVLSGILLEGNPVILLPPQGIKTRSVRKTSFFSFRFFYENREKSGSCLFFLRKSVAPKIDELATDKIITTLLYVLGDGLVRTIQPLR